MDFFSEKIFKKKRAAAEYMTVAVALLGAVLLMWIVLIQGAFGVPRFFISLVPFEIAAVIYGAYRLILSTSVEYEYSVTNDSIDIDKIIAQRRRKRITSVNVRSFEYFAPLTEEHMSVYSDSGISKKINVTSNSGLTAYFAIYFNNSEKTCLIFEPTDEMIQNFARYVPRSLNHTV